MVDTTGAPAAWRTARRDAVGFLMRDFGRRCSTGEVRCRASRRASAASPLARAPKTLMGANGVISAAVGRVPELARPVDRAAVPPRCESATVPAAIVSGTRAARSSVALLRGPRCGDPAGVALRTVRLRARVADRRALAWSSAEPRGALGRTIGCPRRWCSSSSRRISSLSTSGTAAPSTTPGRSSDGAWFAESARWKALAESSTVARTSSGDGTSTPSRSKVPSMFSAAARSCVGGSGGPSSGPKTGRSCRARAASSSCTLAIRPPSGSRPSWLSPPISDIFRTALYHPPNERVALILITLALMRSASSPDDPIVSTPSDEWFTLPQIAEMLDVNPSTVRHWVSIGRLSAEKRGRRWVVAREDLDEIMAQRRRRAGRPPILDVPPEPGEQRRGLSMVESIDLSGDDT